MKCVKVFTAFSGMETQCQALDLLKERHPDFEYELVGWSEIDKYAIQAHNVLFPQYADRNYGDIRNIDWNTVPDFDLFFYSSPCTQISFSGTMAGLKEGSGTESSLLWECKRAIEIKRPKILILENVKALVSRKFINDFLSWVDVLDRFGYHSVWDVLNAKDYGVPQNRERVFCVSLLDKDKVFQFPKPIPLLKRTEDVLQKNVDDKYYLTEEAVKKLSDQYNELLAKKNK